MWTNTKTCVVKTDISFSLGANDDMVSMRSDTLFLFSFVQKLATRLPKTREVREAPHNCLCPPGKILTLHTFIHPHVPYFLLLTDHTQRPLKTNGKLHVFIETVGQHKMRVCK